MTRNTIAHQFNISIETLRYYEDFGLIAPSRNPKNGYGEYGEIEMIKLGIIVKFKQFGFSLKDIKNFFDFLNDDDLDKSRDFTFFIEKKLSEIDDQINGLNSVKEALKKFQTKEDRETCEVYSKLLQKS